MKRASLQTGKTCFQEFRSVKKKTYHLYSLHCCIRPECWQDLTHCFCEQCFHRQHVTPAIMWCLQMCRTLCVSQRGNTWHPKTIQGLLSFFLWQTSNSHLLIVATRRKLDQSWTVLQSVARRVTVLWLSINLAKMLCKSLHPKIKPLLNLLTCILVFGAHFSFSFNT